MDDMIPCHQAAYVGTTVFFAPLAGDPAAMAARELVLQVVELVSGSPKDLHFGYLPPSRGTSWAEKGTGAARKADVSCRAAGLVVIAAVVKSAVVGSV